MRGREQKVDGGEGQETNMGVFYPDPSWACAGARGPPTCPFKPHRCQPSPAHEGIPLLITLL